MLKFYGIEKVDVHMHFNAGNIALLEHTETGDFSFIRSSGISQEILTEPHGNFRGK